MAETYRGVLRGGTVVLLEERTPLPDGTVVLVTPVEPQPGTAAALIAAMEAGPHVPVEWVKELEQIIEAGQRRPMRDDSPTEQGSDQECP
jgi:hypothetical protein